MKMRLEVACYIFVAAFIISGNALADACKSSCRKGSRNERWIPQIESGEVTEILRTNGEVVVDFVLRPTPRSLIRSRLSLAVPNVWDGRLWGIGNGGWAGEIWYAPANGSARFTCDLGTSRTGRNVAPDDVEVIRDYSWRATHLATVAAKRLVEAFYGRKPMRCYFMGASCGGRQGLMEAVCYPEDYDGIVSEVPGFTERSRAAHAWQRERLKRKYGQWFSTDEIAEVRAAELRYFAAQDPEFARGKFIVDPYPTPEKLNGCWREIVASNQRMSNREALWRALFDPVMVNGEAFVPGRLLGIEFDSVWGFMLPKIIGPRSEATTTEAEMSAFGREIDDKRSSDLRAFKARGGKMLMYGGMEDLSCAETEMRAYYDSVLREMGGCEKVQEFYLYFSVPGRTHCARGEAAGTGKIGAAIGLDKQILEWVENGVSPEALSFRWTEEKDKILRVLPYPGNAVLCLPVGEK